MASVKYSLSADKDNAMALGLLDSGSHKQCQHFYSQKRHVQTRKMASALTIRENEERTTEKYFGLYRASETLLRDFHRRSIETKCELNNSLDKCTKIEEIHLAFCENMA